MADSPNLTVTTPGGATQLKLFLPCWHPVAQTNINGWREKTNTYHNIMYSVNALRQNMLAMADFEWQGGYVHVKEHLCKFLANPTVGLGICETELPQGAGPLLIKNANPHPLPHMIPQWGGGV